MITNKPKVIKDYEKLPVEIQEQIKLEYPYGFSDNLITFPYKDGRLVSALPLETDEYYYMVKMTEGEAIKIVEEDDDFGSDGMLKAGIKEELENKYNEDDEDIDSVDDLEDEPEVFD